MKIEKEEKKREKHLENKKITKEFEICRGEVEWCHHVLPLPHVHLIGSVNFLNVPDEQTKVTLTVLETMA